MASRWRAAVPAMALALTLGGCAADAADSGAGSAGATADGTVVRMWVEPERVACVGVGPMECLEVSYAEGGETELFYSSIAGFDHQEGTSYVIDVRVETVESPPADASSLTYTLVEVISETTTP